MERGSFFFSPDLLTGIETPASGHWLPGNVGHVTQKDHWIRPSFTRIQTNQNVGLAWAMTLQNLILNNCLRKR